MNRTLQLLSFLALLLVFSGCDYQLKSAVENYKGDGQIKYLEAPGLLGASGCSIEMPIFDLSGNFDKTYSLANIPKNENYSVYLVVKDPAEIELIKQSHFSFKVNEGEKTIRNVSAPLKDFIASEGGGLTKFYYFKSPQNPETEVEIPLGNSENTNTISISYRNKALVNSQMGYLEIRFGGFK